MRIPLDWLAELVELPGNGTPEEVLEALVRVGLEDEAIHRSGVSGPLTVGRVLSFEEEPQKNGKTIRWVQVDVGEDEPRGIVCGASNFVEGDLVAVALPGTVLPGDFEITARKTYGHVSDGMMASSREVGLGDDHDGIMRLQEMGYEAEPGDDAVALLGLDAVAVEVAVTPDRGYALSMRGIAREVANATGASFTDPAAIEARSSSGFEITLADEAPIRERPGCTRFVARVVEGIDPSAETPAWMAQRLTLAGIRPVSLIVDVTNYVMLELGQPLHAYDMGALTGGITVRRAAPREAIETIDHSRRELHPEDLVIADVSGPVGVAGVMGGAETEVGDETTDVLIEAAWFDPVTVGRSARRHRLHSEASKRFARGVDPTIQEQAAERAAQLLEELGGGFVTERGGVAELASEERPPVSLRKTRAASLMGIDYSEGEQVAALEAIGASVQDAGEAWQVTPPAWRPDLTGEPELVEEIARITGFDRIGADLPTPPPGRGYTPEQRLRRAVRNALAAAGATEVLAMPFLSAAQVERVGIPAVELSNALDAERRWLRPALMPGLIEVAARNASRGLTDVAAFEVGTVFAAVEGAGSEVLPAGAELPSAETLTELNRLPQEALHLGVVLIGNRVPKQPGTAAQPYDLADLVDLVRVAGRVAGTQLTVRQAERPWTHPGRTAEVLLDGEPIGYAAELAPALAKEAALPRVLVAEIDLGRVIEARRTLLEPRLIAPVPAATQDLSLTVAADIPAGDVLASVREGAGPLLEHIGLVDDYRGEGIPEGQKSLTFALRFRAAGRTLTAEEASEAKLAGVARAEAAHGAVLRAE